MGVCVCACLGLCLRRYVCEFVSPWCVCVPNNHTLRSRIIPLENKTMGEDEKWQEMTWSRMVVWIWNPLISPFVDTSLRTIFKSSPKLSNTWWGVLSLFLTPCWLLTQQIYFAKNVSPERTNLWAECLPHCSYELCILLLAFVCKESSTNYDY